MRASAVSFTHKFIAAALAALLTLTLAPLAHADGEGSNEGNPGVVASALADQSNDSADPSVILSEGTEGPSPSVTLREAAEGDEVEGSNKRPLTLASGLAGRPSNFINSDVALDSEPIIGSFTVDGLTYAVIDGPYVELVGVSPSAILSEGSEAAGVDESNSNHASEAGVTNLALPETVSYEGVSHIVSSIGAYAFYLSGVTDVTLPASVSDVDDRAFRSSDVASVAVAEGNPAYSSFDGALYDAEQLSLLLIPEGKQGAVLLPKTAEVAEASVFSHCPLVDSISVEKDGAAFASENGLLYDSDLTTLLRVPAGATEIAIREGCTTIAAGALEACAKLTTINAPTTVTSISPDVFHAVPTVSLPAIALGEENPQLTAMVALSTTDDDLPEANAIDIRVSLAENADVALWRELGFQCWGSDCAGATSNTMLANEVADDEALMAAVREAASYQADTMTHVATVGKNEDAGGTGFVEISPDFEWTRATDAYAAVPSGAVEDLEYAQGNWLPLTWRNIYVYSHARYGYIWGGTSGDPVMYIHARDKATHRRLKIGSYNLKKPTGCTTSGHRPYPVMFDDIQLPFTLSFDPAGGVWDDGAAEAKDVANIPYSLSNQVISIPQPALQGMEFLGWYDAKGKQVFAPGQLTATSDISQFDAELSDGSSFQLSAQWKRMGFNLGFDVDSEPGDEDYPGIDKPDQEVNIEDGPTVIEDPKRPGYVFQGWTIPNAEGAEAIDQDLVYEGEDGKWYVDASKLPDYAGDDGRVELTARWTSVISVDVPSSVTFYADVVTQGNESREGLASSAFGQNKVASQSEVDLRIVGLESNQVKGNGSTSLGASDILKKKDGSTVSGTADKLFSLYPATGELKEDDLKDPDATSASKPVGAVDFSLDDILLEKSFVADKFTIPAGDTLSLGYRLNLQETNTELDYDKLSTLSEGASASIANISYCFATQGILPTGSKADPLWVENTNPDWGLVGVYGTYDIKQAARYLSARAEKAAPVNNAEGTLLKSGEPEGDAIWQEKDPVYRLFKSFLDNPDACLFRLRVGSGTCNIQLIGICQDDMSTGGKAGLTFCFRDLWAYGGQTVFGAKIRTYMNSGASNAGGWDSTAMRTYLQGTFVNSLDSALVNSDTGIVPVTKTHQLGSGDGCGIQTSSEQTVWLPSLYEVYGLSINGYNDDEEANNSFQYQYFAKGGASSSNAYANKKWSTMAAQNWWSRSAYRANATHFGYMDHRGYAYNWYAYSDSGCVPCFCL